MLVAIYQTTKNNQNMYSLKTSTKRNNSLLNHIKVRLTDKIQYVEMRRHSLYTNSIHHVYPSRKCENVFKYSENIDDSTMPNLMNYGFSHLSQLSRDKKLWNMKNVKTRKKMFQKDVKKLSVITAKKYSRICPTSGTTYFKL